jgi:hypothetical protein
MEMTNSSRRSSGTSAEASVLSQRYCCQSMKFWVANPAQGIWTMAGPLTLPPSTVRQSAEEPFVVRICPYPPLVGTKVND